jgi:hypothetical protein
MDNIDNVLYFAVFSLVVTIMIYSLSLIAGIVRGIIYTQRCQNETIEFETKRFQLYSSIEQVKYSVNMFFDILYLLLYLAIIIGPAYILYNNVGNFFEGSLFLFNLAYPGIMFFVPLIIILVISIPNILEDDETQSIKFEQDAYFYVIPICFIITLFIYKLASSKNFTDIIPLALYYSAFVSTGLFIINILNFILEYKDVFVFKDIFENRGANSLEHFQRRFWILFVMTIIFHVLFVYKFNISREPNLIDIDIDLYKKFTLAIVCSFITILVMSSIIQTLAIEFHQHYEKNIENLQKKFNEIGNRNGSTYLNDINFNYVLQHKSTHFLEDNAINEYIEAFHEKDLGDEKKQLTNESGEKEMIINIINANRNIYGKLYNIHNIYIKLTKNYQVVDEDQENNQDSCPQSGENTETYEIINDQNPNIYESTFMNKYRKRIAKKIKQIKHNCDKSIPTQLTNEDASQTDIDKANFINFILCSGNSQPPIMTPTEQNIEDIVRIFREFSNEFNKTHIAQFDKYVINNYNASHNDGYKCTSIELDSEGKINATNPNIFELNGCCYFPFFENDPDKFKVKLENFNINADGDVMNDIQTCLQEIHDTEQKYANYQIISIIIILAVFSLVFCASYYTHKNIESTNYPMGILAVIVLMMFAITVMTIVYNIRDGIN